MDKEIAQAQRRLQENLRAYKRKQITKERYESEHKKIKRFLVERGVSLKIQS